MISCHRVGHVPDSPSYSRRWHVFQKPHALHHLSYAQSAGFISRLDRLPKGQGFGRPTCHRNAPSSGLSGRLNRNMSGICAPARGTPEKSSSLDPPSPSETFTVFSRIVDWAARFCNTSELTPLRCGIGPFQPHLDHFRTTLRAPNANNRVDEIAAQTPHVQCAGEAIGAAFPAFLRGPILKHNDNIQRNSVEPKAIASTLRKVQSARLSGWPNLLGRNGFEPGKA